MARYAPPIIRNGSRWYSDPGDPASNVGLDGDYYLNLTNGAVWEKTGGTWVDTGSVMKGADGADGTNGTDGANGADGIDGNTIGRQTIWLPSPALIPAETAGPTLESIETSTNLINYKALRFSGSVRQNAHVNIGMPKSWDHTSTFVARARWMTAASDADSVVWGCEARAVGDGDDLNGAWGTAATVADAAQSSADKMMMTSFITAITPSNSPAQGDTVFFRFFRDPADAGDTIAETVDLIGFDIGYTINAANDD